MSLWQVVGARQAAFTLLLSDAVLRSPNNYLNPLGVGAFALSEAGEVRGEPYKYGLYLHAMRIDDQFGPTFMEAPDWFPLSELEPIKQQLEVDFPEEAKIFLEDGWAFIGPPPTLHAGTGDLALTTASIGTFGAQITWGSAHGLLTAGHVGGSVGNLVHALSPGSFSFPAQQVGKVAFCQTAAAAGANGGADIAVVELSGNQPISWGGKRSFVARPLDPIQVIRNAGPAQALVKGMYRWLAYPGTNIVFADTYMTDQPITQPGDSGAVAIDPQTGNIAGHVVGGTAQVASYIQEIDYQLRTIA